MACRAEHTCLGLFRGIFLILRLRGSFVWFRSSLLVPLILVPQIVDLNIDLLLALLSIGIWRKGFDVINSCVENLSDWVLSHQAFHPVITKVAWCLNDWSVSWQSFNGNFLVEHVLERHAVISEPGLLTWKSAELVWLVNLFYHNVLSFW